MRVTIVTIANKNKNHINLKSKRIPRRMSSNHLRKKHNRHISKWVNIKSHAPTKKDNLFRVFDIVKMNRKQDLDATECISIFWKHISPIPLSRIAKCDNLIHCNTTTLFLWVEREHMKNWSFWSFTIKLHPKLHDLTRYDQQLEKIEKMKQRTTP